MRIWGALLIAWLVTRVLSMHWIQSFVSRCKSKNYPELPVEEAETMLRDLRKVNGIVRIACLEESLACVLLAHWQKKSVSWCIGVKLSPFSSHAWIEINEVPVEQFGSYKKILSV